MKGYYYFRLLMLLFGINFLAINILSGQNRRIPSEKPRLIIGITVDQMRYDYIYRYWDKLSTGGIKKLINEGTFCSNTKVNYLFSRNSVGYTSISTGTYPAYHGIVGDDWYVELEDEVKGCAEDEEAMPVGGSYEMGKFSPHHIVTTSVSDELKLLYGDRSRVYSISMYPEIAVLSGGHTCDGAYWMDGKTGEWMSSDYYIDSLASWVKSFNQKQLAQTYMEKSWEPLIDPDNYFGTDESDYESGINGQISFPYELSRLQKKFPDERKYELLKHTPFGNTYTKDFAIQTILEENLGKNEVTDFLYLNFSSTQKISTSYGPSSVELEDAILRLDKELEFFLNFIHNELGKENVLIYLTSASGVSYAPSYLEKMKIPSGYFNSMAAISLLKSYLNVVYGEGDWIRYYHNQQIYLNRELIEYSKLPLKEVQDKIAQFMIQFSGVANSVTATTLQTTNFTGGIFNQIQNSYNQKVSGDIIITLMPGWVEKSEAATGYNSAYNYDSHVPLIWYGWQIGRQKITDQIEVIDIAPTLSTFLNISYPGACIGQPIRGLQK